MFLERTPGPCVPCPLGYRPQVINLPLYSPFRGDTRTIPNWSVSPIEKSQRKFSVWAAVFDGNMGHQSTGTTCKFTRNRDSRDIPLDIYFGLTKIWMNPTKIPNSLISGWMFRKICTRPSRVTRWPATPTQSTPGGWINARPQMAPTAPGLTLDGGSGEVG